jgi:hypothetical protein
MTDYESMSDFEINKAVAVALGYKPEPDDEYRAMSMIGLSTKPDESVMWYEGKTYRSADYCNNPSDAWPIIVESGISMIRVQGSDYCGMHAGLSFRDGMTSDHAYHSENPLRAAMIVYLMMMEKNND